MGKRKKKKKYIAISAITNEEKRRGGLTVGRRKVEVKERRRCGQSVDFDLIGLFDL